eukprot:357117-Chlamydomonas_euryale.AAC.7
MCAKAHQAALVFTSMREHMSVDSQKQPSATGSASTRSKGEAYKCPYIAKRSAGGEERRQLAGNYRQAPRVNFNSGDAQSCWLLPCIEVQVCAAAMAARGCPRPCGCTLCGSYSLASWLCICGAASRVGSNVGSKLLNSSRSAGVMTLSTGVTAPPSPESSLMPPMQRPAHAAGTAVAGAAARFARFPPPTASCCAPVSPPPLPAPSSSQPGGHAAAAAARPWSSTHMAAAWRPPGCTRNLAVKVKRAAADRPPCARCRLAERLGRLQVVLPQRVLCGGESEE